MTRRAHPASVARKSLATDGVSGILRSEELAVSRPSILAWDGNKCFVGTPSNLYCLNEILLRDFANQSRIKEILHQSWPGCGYETVSR